MNHGVLLALRRNRETAAKAGMTERVALLDERIALYEAELLQPAPEPAVPVKEEVAAPEEVPAELPAGVVMTPAAQALADELGVTAEDLRGLEPSGKAGDYLMGDVRRVAEAKAHTEEETPHGDQ